MSGKNVTETRRADAQGIVRAGTVLRRGGLVAVPTETVYGLAARADNAQAVARIYTAKGRPAHNPLIVHVRDMAQAQEIADFSPMAQAVAELVWPGPLTLVLPLRQGVRGAGLAQAVTAGLDTVALRISEHQVMQAVLGQLSCPLAAPSANLSETVSPTCAEHVLATLDGRIDLVLDGGDSEKGLESSILAIRHDGTWEELRPGPVDLDLLHRHFFDRPVGGVDNLEDNAGDKASGQTIEAPGQMQRHYAPGKPMRLNADSARPDEFMIGFGALSGDTQLSATGDLGQAAARFYACLHEAANAPHPHIAVARIPDAGVGRAINDRLRRAAA